MKKSLIIFVLVLTSLSVFSDTKAVGKNSFVSYDKLMNFGIDVVVARKNLDNKFLAIRFNAAGNKDQHIHLDRDSFVLVYKGKEYKMPSYKYVKKNYKSSLVDRQLFKVNPQNIEISTSRKCVFISVDFFPARNIGLIDNYAYINYQVGATGYLIFENPGIKKGEQVTLKVLDKKERNVMNTITVTI